ncbi:MAG TPA: efflux RND transporter permease subunit [Candidatus Angelobacter sp.]|nr:efflux RND transporter permease subunit [Candidatus Angelobacter sp.]
MNLPQFALRRPFTVIVMVIAVAVVSVLSWRQMPKDIFPTLGIPTIYIAQPYGGMDPAQMEGYLTYYYEYHFLFVAGIEHIESKSIQGAAIIKLQFHPGTNMPQAMAETVAYVNAARAFMPTGTLPPFITRFDAGSVPVGQLVFSSETRSVTEMQDAALNLVRPLFATLPGVSAPPPFGGSARTIVVNINPDRLNSNKISPDEVVDAITQANLISPSGNMMMGGKYPMVPLNSIPRNVKELEGVPIHTGVYPAVFVRDVAQVVDGADIVTSYALVNGRRTVYIPVTKRADASTLAVVNLVKENLPKFQSVLPSDVHVSYEFDQSGYVKRALTGLIQEGVLGAILTGLMVLIFLRDWRSAIIVIINIPVSLMAAMLALRLTGNTINLMTLGGLALAVGILVDEATVCLENIHVHLPRDKSLARAALDATDETRIPRLLAMLCILAMFTPALFMTGAARAMFLPLALAVGFSMVASYFLSSTVVPLLSVWLLRGRENSTEKWKANESAFAGFQGAYESLLQRLVPWRKALIVAYLAGALAIIVLVGKQLGVEIFPQVDSGQLQVRLRAPAGTDIDGTEAVFLKALNLIKKKVGPDNVAISLGLIGIHGANFPINFVHLWNGGPEEGVLQVQIKAGTKIRIDELKEQLRREFAAQMPSANFSFEPAGIVSRVMSLGADTPIEVAVSGQDLATSRAFAEKVKTKLEGVAILRDVQFGQSLDYPTVNVKVDRERAGIIGPDMKEVSKALVPATWSSRFVNLNYWADPNTGVAYQVQVQIPQRLMTSLEDVGNIPVLQHKPKDPEKKLKDVTLRNIAEITEGTAMGEYERYNMQRLITVRANLYGNDLAGAAGQVRNAIAELGPPPPGVSVALRGQVVPLQEMLDGLRGGLVLAVVAIFLLLTANFQSLKMSFIVVSTVPAVLAGVVMALWLTDTTLNIQSFMGAIMGVGVAVANAILLVTFAENSRLGGASAVDAGVEGARSRLRPILMTSAAMIAGMMPMALSLGESGGQAAPLGRAVVGGLSAATIATLFVLPSVFAVVQSRSHRRAASLDPNDPQSSHYQPSDGRS